MVLKLMDRRQANKGKRVKPDISLSPEAVELALTDYMHKHVPLLAKTDLDDREIETTLTVLTENDNIVGLRVSFKE